MYLLLNLVKYLGTMQVVCLYIIYVFLYYHINVVRVKAKDSESEERTGELRPGISEYIAYIVKVLQFRKGRI